MSSKDINLKKKPPIWVQNCVISVWVETKCVVWFKLSPSYFDAFETLFNVQICFPVLAIFVLSETIIILKYHHYCAVPYYQHTAQPEPNYFKKLCLVPSHQFIKLRRQLLQCLSKTFQNVNTYHLLNRTLKMAHGNPVYHQNCTAVSRL